MGRIICLAGGSGSDTEDERLPNGTRVKVRAQVRQRLQWRFTDIELSAVANDCLPFSYGIP